MASSYTNLGVELMATGEKAGQWGTITNTNLNIIEQISGGYAAQALTDGGTLTLRSDELHLAKGESLPDTAKILSTYGNAFMLRTDSDQKLSEFKKYMTIPIINGLSPSSHPTQVLSDVFTIEEIMKKSISKLNICKDINETL